MSNYNSASRILDLIRKARSLSGKHYPSDIYTWIEVFKLSGYKSHHAHSKLLRLIGLLVEELNLLGVKLQQKGYEQHVFQTEIEKLRGYFSIESLYRTGTHEKTRFYLDQRNISVLALALKHWSEVLGSDAKPIPVAEYNALADEGAAFLNWVYTSDLSGPMQRFVINQIEAIREALREYHIVGPVAFSNGIIQLATNTVQFAAMPKDCKRPEDKVAHEANLRLGRCWGWMEGWTKKSQEPLYLMASRILQNAGTFVSGDTLFASR